MEVLQDVSDRGIFFLGCGKMGTALLKRWLEQGIPLTTVWVRDRSPSEWLAELGKKGLKLNTSLPKKPAIVIIAVKPQSIKQALLELSPFRNNTLFMTVAAGTMLATYEKILGEGARIIRAMPNTPSIIGRGITAIIGNRSVYPSDLDMAEQLLRAVGQVVRLNSEEQMDTVTAVSGSGPAYIFYMIEALTKAGKIHGLPPDIAMKLAHATICGASELAYQSTQSAEELRQGVTSPGGTTQAALNVLMHDETGLAALMRKAVHAAAERSMELAKDQ